MNEVLKTIRQRRSVRKFSPRPVDEKDLELILEAARLAPSANNLQPWYFIVVSDKSLLDAMARAVVEKVDFICRNLEDEELARRFRKYCAYYTFFNSAPTVIVVLKTENNNYLSKLGVSNELLQRIGFADRDGNRKGHPDLQSVAAAIQNILLAATSLGYGSCWMTGPLIAAKELAELLGVEEIRKARQTDSQWEIVALIPLGRPAMALGLKRLGRKNRKPLAQIVKYL